MPSLGWGVLNWMARYLPSPADATQPLYLSDEQAKLVVQWYELDPLGGFVYRRAILEMAKGWGKSPLAGAISLAEFDGPVLFSGWDRAGEPLPAHRWGEQGSPPPWVQIAAVSEDQTDNTYSALYEML